MNNLLQKLTPDYVNASLETIANQTSAFFIKLGEQAKQHLIGFHDRVRLFEKLVKTPQSKFKFTPLQNYFLQEKFPIVLISENEDKIVLFNFTTHEYRSNSSLKLGHDIKIIATDTPNHRLEIMKYLEPHHINNIQVVLFDDLQKSKKSHKKPSAPHHHLDGVPTLKWLSAQKISSKDLTFFKAINSEKNLKEVEGLLEDAQKYQAIDFTKI